MAVWHNGLTWEHPSGVTENVFRAKFRNLYDFCCHFRGPFLPVFIWKWILNFVVLRFFWVIAVLCFFAFLRTHVPSLINRGRNHFISSAWLTDFRTSSVRYNTEGGQVSPFRQNSINYCQKQGLKSEMLNNPEIKSIDIRQAERLFHKTSEVSEVSAIDAATIAVLFVFKFTRL